MTLPWVRLDTGFPQNPKILALVDGKRYKSALVYVSSLAYSGSQATDGFIPKAALTFIHGTRKNTVELVEVGLWVVDERGGWSIPDWHDYQLSSSQVEARRASARRAANLRWDRQRGDAK